MKDSDDSSEPLERRIHHLVLRRKRDQGFTITGNGLSSHLEVSDFRFFHRYSSATNIEKYHSLEELENDKEARPVKSYKAALVKITGIEGLEEPLLVTELATRPLAERLDIKIVTDAFNNSVGIAFHADESYLILRDELLPYSPLAVKK